jgi:hypothetical protein
MVLANILQSLSGSVNAVYIGQMLGTDALAAVAGMFPVFFFIALIIGVGAGASVLIGQAWGAREPQGQSHCRHRAGAGRPDRRGGRRAGRAAGPPGAGCAGHGARAAA